MRHWNIKRECGIFRQQKSNHCWYWPFLPLSLEILYCDWQTDIQWEVRNLRTVHNSIFQFHRIFHAMISVLTSMSIMFIAICFDLYGPFIFLYISRLHQRCINCWINFSLNYPLFTVVLLISLLSFVLRTCYNCPSLILGLQSMYSNVVS